MVEAQQLFRLFGTLANFLFGINILGLSMIQWFVVFWGLAIVGWALQIMYGRGDK